jgi:pSer/pThr/pTyr-binding forkhead associated (FHA) protein
MGGDRGEFLEACGASGPLRLEWDDRETGQPVRREFDRPAVVLGSNARADLVLDHPGVAHRHAYLQLVEGRLFAIDLETRDGLRWGGVPRPAGWLDPGRPVQVGPVTVGVVSDCGVAASPAPGPMSRRYESRQPLPSVTLEFRSPEGRQRLSLERVLTLAGSSARCHLRVSGSKTSRFLCGLVRTPSGVWVVDLLSSRGVVVNGVACRLVRLEDGDVLRLGTRALRLIYGGGTPSSPRRVDEAASVPAVVLDTALLGEGVGRLLPALLDPPGELLSEAVLRPLLDGGEVGPALASSPFGQALVLLIRLLGDVHRDHLKFVREELEQIRRLNHDMSAARAALTPPDPGVPAVKPAGEPAADPDLPWPADTGLTPEQAPCERLVDPQEILSVVGERFASWEQERRGRWQRVIELLIKP